MVFGFCSCSCINKPNSNWRENIFAFVISFFFIAEIIIIAEMIYICYQISILYYLDVCGNRKLLEIFTVSICLWWMLFSGMPVVFWWSIETWERCYQQRQTGGVQRCSSADKLTKAIWKKHLIYLQRCTDY